jgi:phospholipid transport system substrate-binding protein
MAFHRLRIFSAALVTAVLIAASASAQQDGAAQKVVEQFHATLINVMKESKNLGYDGRFQWLKPAVQDTFNIPFMAEVTAGIYWAKATEEQRQKFVEVFGKMSTATYAERFDDYGGEAFATEGADEEGRNSIVVRTQLTDRDGGHTQISYLLRNFDGGWKAVDVYLNGSISELAVKKSDYASVLKTGGMDALIDALNEKIAALAKAEARAESSATAKSDPKLDPPSNSKAP